MFSCIERCRIGTFELQSETGRKHWKRGTKKIFDPGFSEVALAKQTIANQETITLTNRLTVFQVSLKAQQATPVQSLFVCNHGCGSGDAW
jgi:hypothetical protein